MAFANALASVFPDHDVLREGITRYEETFNEAMPAMQGEKFGLVITEALWTTEEDELVLLRDPRAAAATKAGDRARSL